MHHSIQWPVRHFARSNSWWAHPFFLSFILLSCTWLMNCMIRPWKEREQKDRRTKEKWTRIHSGIITNTSFHPKHKCPDPFQASVKHLASHFSHQDQGRLKHHLWSEVDIKVKLTCLIFIMENACCMSNLAIKLLCVGCSQIFIHHWAIIMGRAYYHVVISFAMIFLARICYSSFWK